MYLSSTELDQALLASVLFSPNYFPYNLLGSKVTEFYQIWPGPLPLYNTSVPLKFHCLRTPISSASRVQRLCPAAAATGLSPGPINKKVSWSPLTIFCLALMEAHTDTAAGRSVKPWLNVSVSEGNLTKQHVVGWQQWCHCWGGHDNIWLRSCF